MIVILGDIHFRDDKPWSEKVSNDFISWFSSWNLNNENNTLLLAGDLVERATNNGLVFLYIEKFISASKFREIHICVGNHDRKILYGRYQLAYEYLKQRDFIKIYEDVDDVFIEGKRILFLPYFQGENSYQSSMKEYYSNLYKNALYCNNTYDLIIGHFSDDLIPFGGNDSIYNLEKLNAKKICLGHIHTRTFNPERYIGSVMANRKGENDNTRAAWYLDKDDVWKEDRLPCFLEFLTVTYPNQLPSSQALNPIYTVFNCNSEQDIRKLYGNNIWIRKYTKESFELSYRKEDDIERQLKNIRNMDILQLFSLFKEFQSHQQKTLSPDLLKKCENLLKRRALTSTN